MSKGLLIILSAPSGTGKTTICRNLEKRNPEWKFSVSATTRPIGEGEIDGVDYIFMDIDKFEHYVKFGDFIEWEWVHGNKYGTLITPLEETLENGEMMLLDIDVKGGLTIMEEFPAEALSIFIEPPGDTLGEQLEILEARLRKRGRESSTLIRRRLKRFQNELEYKEQFDFHLINEDIEKVTDEIDKIIKEKFSEYSNNSI